MTGFLAVLLALNLSACDRTSGPEAAGDGGEVGASLVVQPDSASATVGDTLQFEARVVDGAGSVLSGYGYTWSVSDTTAATVDDEGTLVSRASGNTDLTVEATDSNGGGTLSSGAPVAVTPRRVARVSVSPSSPSIELGDTVQLAATVTSEDGEELDRNVRWSSSDTSVVRAGEGGTITGEGEGQASVSARTSNVADTTGVSVELTPAGSVDVTPDSTSIGPGATTQLEATVRDSAGDELDRSVSWSSSNTSVATVDALGQVQAQVEGEAVITARSGEASGTSRIVVESSESAPSRPASVSVSEGSRTDTTVQYTAEWSESEGADHYGWSAGSNDGLWNRTASTSDTSASFTAPRSDTDDESYFCTSAVNDAGTSENACEPFTVPAVSGSDSVATVVVSPDSTELGSLGRTYDFTAEARNENGQTLSDVSFDWSSSNTAVATVDNTGQVTAQAQGTASILTVAEDVADTATLVVDTSSSNNDPGDWVFRENEPAGYTALLNDDHDNESGPMSYQNGSGSYSIAYPSEEVGVGGEGADGVYRTNYPEGMADGRDAANAWDGGSGVNSFYWAYTIRFSDNWAHHSNMVKHNGWMWGSQIGGFLGWRLDDGGIYPEFTTSDPDGGKLRVAPNLVYNANDENTSDPPDPSDADAYISIGEWHQVEFQVVVSEATDLKDFRVWIDGTLVLEQTDVPVDEGPHVGQDLGELKYFNTWGGGGQDVPHDQYIDIGHTYLSGTQ